MTSDANDQNLAMTPSAELEEKSMAFDNLAVYAVSMRDAFDPWLAPCMETTLDALRFVYSEDVREAAAL